MLHGCIPVIIIDEVHVVFESLLVRWTCASRAGLWTRRMDG